MDAAARRVPGGGGIYKISYKIIYEIPSVL